MWLFVYYQIWIHSFILTQVLLYTSEYLDAHSNITLLDKIVFNIHTAKNNDKFLKKSVLFPKIRTFFSQNEWKNLKSANYSPIWTKCSFWEKKSQFFGENDRFFFTIFPSAGLYFAILWKYPIKNIKIIYGLCYHWTFPCCSFVIYF